MTPPPLPLDAWYAVTREVEDKRASQPPAIAKTPWELAFPPELPPEETLELRFRSELYEDDEDNN